MTTPKPTFRCIPIIFLLAFIILNNKIAHAQEKFIYHLNLSFNWNQDASKELLFKTLTGKGQLPRPYILLNGDFVGLLPSIIEISSTQLPAIIEIALPQIPTMALYRTTLTKEHFNSEDKSISISLLAKEIINNSQSWPKKSNPKEEVKIPFLDEVGLGTSSLISPDHISEHGLKLELPIFPYYAFIEYTSTVLELKAQKFWRIPIREFTDTALTYTRVAHVKLELFSKIREKTISFLNALLGFGSNKEVSFTINSTPTGAKIWHGGYLLKDYETNRSGVSVPGGEIDHVALTLDGYKQCTTNKIAPKLIELSNSKTKPKLKKMSANGGEDVYHCNMAKVKWMSQMQK